MYLASVRGYDKHLCVSYSVWAALSVADADSPSIEFASVCRVVKECRAEGGTVLRVASTETTLAVLYGFNFSISCTPAWLSRRSDSPVYFAPLASKTASNTAYGSGMNASRSASLATINAKVGVCTRPRLMALPAPDTTDIALVKFIPTSQSPCDLALAAWCKLSKVAAGCNAPIALTTASRLSASDVQNLNVGPFQEQ